MAGKIAYIDFKDMEKTSVGQFKADFNVYKTFRESDIVIGRNLTLDTTGMVGIGDSVVVNIGDYNGTGVGGGKCVIGFFMALNGDNLQHYKMEVRENNTLQMYSL